MENLEVYIGITDMYRYALMFDPIWLCIFPDEVLAANINSIFSPRAIEIDEKNNITFSNLEKVPFFSLFFFYFITAIM